MSTDTRQPDEKNIGRRTFLGLVLAGVLALFLGKDIFPRLTTGGSSGGPAGTASGDGESGGVDSATDGFRINTAGGVPVFDPETWRLTVDGLVAAPLAFTFAEFLALPQTTVTRDFYCVEGWGVEGVEWKGVSLSELVRRAQVDPKATHLIFHSGDKVYTDSLTLEQAGLEDVLLVHQVNGVPLPRNLGQPVRLIHPGHYGYKYVKWVERVEAVDGGVTDTKGYWEGYGYSEDATIP